MTNLRDQIIQTLLATRGQSEGVTADALLAIMSTTGVEAAAQKPVAWVYETTHGRAVSFNSIQADDLQKGTVVTPLFAHPPHAADDAVLRDAERYRWLRSNNVGPSQIEKVSDDRNPPYFTLKCEAELDAAIDAAMTKEQGDDNKTV